MKGDLLFILAGNLGGGVERFIETVKQTEIHNLKQFLAILDQPSPDVFKVFCEEGANDFYSLGQRRTRAASRTICSLTAAPRITEIRDLLLRDATDFNVIVYPQHFQNLMQIEGSANPTSVFALLLNSRGIPCNWDAVAMQRFSTIGFVVFLTLAGRASSCRGVGAHADPAAGRRPAGCPRGAGADLPGRAEAGPLSPRHRASVDGGHRACAC